MTREAFLLIFLFLEGVPIGWESIGGGALELSHLFLLDHPEKFLLADLRGRFLRCQTESHRHTIKDGLRPRRTSGNIEIDRDGLLDPAQKTIGIKPDIAATCAISNSENELRIRSGFIQSLKGWQHLAGNWTRDEQHVCMPRRTHQFDAKSLRIIVWGKYINYFDIAAIAGTRVGMIDPQSLGEGFPAKGF
jgi:hypothetical protein